MNSSTVSEQTVEGGRVLHHEEVPAIVATGLPTSPRRLTHGHDGLSASQRLDRSEQSFRDAPRGKTEAVEMGIVMWMIMIAMMAVMAGAIVWSALSGGLSRMSDAVRRGRSVDTDR